MSNSPQPLTPARLEAIKAQVHPGLFLKTFNTLVNKEGSEILQTLFAMAKGTWHEEVDPVSGATVRVMRSDPKDVLTAIKIIMEMGAFKEVIKHLLKVAQKGRPGQDEGTPEWLGEYAALLEAPPPPPEKK